MSFRSKLQRKSLEKCACFRVRVCVWKKWRFVRWDVSCTRRVETKLKTERPDAICRYPLRFYILHGCLSWLWSTYRSFFGTRPIGYSHTPAATSSSLQDLWHWARNFGAPTTRSIYYYFFLLLFYCARVEQKKNTKIHQKIQFFFRLCVFWVASWKFLILSGNFMLFLLSNWIETTRTLYTNEESRLMDRRLKFRLLATWSIECIEFIRFWQFYDMKSKLNVESHFI